MSGKTAADLNHQVGTESANPKDGRSADHETYDRSNCLMCPLSKDHDKDYTISLDTGEGYRCGCGCEFLWVSKDEWKILKFPGRVPPGKVEVVSMDNSNGFDKMIKNAHKIIMGEKDIFLVTIADNIPQEQFARIRHQLESVLGTKQKTLILTSGIDVRKITPTDLLELDGRLIQLTKDLYTKVDEAKAEIRDHVVKHHRDDDIYKFLTHTKRGRILCRLFGYRTSNQRRLNFIAKKQKIKSKLNKLEV